MSDPCGNCKALCCQYFCFEIDEPDEYDEFEDIRWYLCHEGVSVHIDEDDDWYIQIENKCQMLDENHRCTIYENRPLICRNYDYDGCEATGGDFGYQEEFLTPEQLDAYARKTLGVAVYERDMVKHRAELAGVTKKGMRENLIKLGHVTLPSKSKKKTPKKKRK
ncbi:MAG: YkgJ family cysteine cluster protein [Phycisphaerae bacterium]|nr:YkgJ family cysteine cluster protein [Phycisphaerae bacterium]